MPEWSALPRHPRLTTDRGEFIRQLRHGDILLFDTLNEISHSIKLVDNSPVNHCALYKEPDGKQKGMVLYAGLPLEKGGPSIREEPLLTVLDGNDWALRTIRTATALRVANPAVGIKAVETGDAWLQRTNHYAFKRLLSLAAQCINRAYGAADRPSAKQLCRAAGFVLKAELTWRDRWPSLPDHRPSVTCSEFVYSCYVAADRASVAIHDPIARWKKGKQVESYASSEWGPLDDRPGKRRKRDVPDITFCHLPGGLRSPPLRWIWPGFVGTLEREASELKSAKDKNYVHKKNPLVPEDPPKEDRAAGRADQDSGPYPGTVTPFDLWQSPSLNAVAILHLPPLGNDAQRLRLGKRVRT